MKYIYTRHTIYRYYGLDRCTYDKRITIHIKSTIYIRCLLRYLYAQFLLLCAIHMIWTVTINQSNFFGLLVAALHSDPLSVRH